ncbi:MAG: hypothetical protein NTV82_01135 [Candidatus Aminicenantes bacterium]|nr:hypothetical protein [Candidatus Aminicenantes bacterium]
MCKSFSGIVKENGDVLWEFGIDGHEQLLQKHRLKDDGNKQDWARFEIAPANGSYLQPDEWKFKLDESPAPQWFSKIHEREAFKAWKDWKNRLDKILIYKPIIHPFRDIKSPEKITKKQLALLGQWARVQAGMGASVWDSVGAGAWAGVGASVWANVRDSVGGSVGASVGAGVGTSAWASVGASVWASTWDSVGVSVWDSVWAYIGSFFNLPRFAWKYTENIECAGYPFQPAVDLWMMGLVPSYDGKNWRLHGGPKGKMLWKGTIEILALLNGNIEFPK